MLPGQQKNTGGYEGRSFPHTSPTKISRYVYHTDFSEKWNKANFEDF